MSAEETIVALSSGTLPSGVAVIRVSGAASSKLIKSLCGRLPEPRKAMLAKISDPGSGEAIDMGLVFWFPGPASFTGEDCAELQVHGGRAVVSRLLEVLCEAGGTRLAEAGEFTRRAFENGKIDLTEAEGLADLISSQTEAQRRLALSQSDGKLREKYQVWRDRLIRIQALFAADVDFADEGDVPDEVSKAARPDIERLVVDLKEHLNDQRRGEIIRDGYRIAITGKPNAGKSSLLNTLARRDVAIVSDQAGTTRDVLEVRLDVHGYEVILFDTAGIRVSEDIVEREGISRAKHAAQESDLVLWLTEDLEDEPEVDAFADRPLLMLRSKDDEAALDDGYSISAKTGKGIDWLLSDILSRITSSGGAEESGLITRQRHRLHIEDALDALEKVYAEPMTTLDIQIELLRLASHSLGRVIGVMDVEDLLDVIFSEFCVGK